jgi:hypothetical protein
LEDTRQKKGTLTIRMDGRWDIEDLLQVADLLKDSYAYFYVVAQSGSQDNKHLEDMIRDHFWGGKYSIHRINENLYRSIPKDHALKIKSIKYASPGAMEIMGVLGVLMAMAKVADAWLKTGGNFFDLYQRVEKYFKDRPQYTKPNQKIEVTENTSSDVDVARDLVFEFGKSLGYDQNECEKLIDIVGTPISALKFQVALARETRKIQALHRRGLLDLPTPPKSTNKND